MSAPTPPTATLAAELTRQLQSAILGAVDGTSVSFLVSHAVYVAVLRASGERLDEKYARALETSVLERLE